LKELIARNKQFQEVVVVSVHCQCGANSNGRGVAETKAMNPHSPSFTPHISRFLVPGTGAMPESFLRIPGSQGLEDMQGRFGWSSAKA